MPPTPVELRPTIDRAWLERAHGSEPLTHAYALWDLSRNPHLVRFVSATRGEETVGYLLFWLGGGELTVVHWFGAPDVASALLTALPTPPFVAVVPPEVEPLVARRFGEVRSSALRMMVREPAGLDAGPVAARRLGRGDVGALGELVRSHVELDVAGYAGLDPAVEPAWGVFDGEGLVGAARAAVRLPALWVVGGVFVEPALRGRGLGRALVMAVVREAERSGARAGLYVREEPAAALRLYEGLGFREVGRRVWMDVGAPPGRRPLAGPAAGGPRAR